MEEHPERREKPSRSALKRAAKEVEETARQLVEMPEAELAQLALDAELAQEVELARETRGRGSHKRQVKHLAGMLRHRGEELIELRGALDGLHQVRNAEARALHELEALRERLCDPEQGEKALAEVAGRWPALDSAALSRKVRAVRSSKDKKAFREIYRMLRDAAGP